MTRTIAHRGGTGLRPENTLASFRHGIALGAHGIELDVHLTSDNVVVVHHDATLNPATTRRGGAFISERVPIAAMTHNDLATLDVGRRNHNHPYSKRHPDQLPVDGEGIPTLDEVLDVLPDDRWLLAEIKSSVTDKIPFAEVEQLVTATLDVLKARNRLGNSIIMAFDWRALTIARQSAPDCHCSYTTVPRNWIDGNLPQEHRGLPESLLQRMQELSVDPTVDWVGGVQRSGPSAPEQIARLGGKFWTPYFRDVTDETVAQAQQLGLSIIPWTVDDTVEMARLKELGVWGIITDRPDRLRS
jgi:glycerophosphoryl diester phosphodiesterase